MEPRRTDRSPEIIRRSDSLIIMEPPDSPDSYERTMFLTCHIEGIVPAKSAYLRDSRCLIYDLSGWQSLTNREKAFGGGPDLGSRVLRQYQALKKTLPMYLLREDHLLAAPDFVYENEAGKIAFIYLPGTLAEALAGTIPERFRWDSLTESGPAREGWDEGAQEGLQEDPDAGRYYDRMIEEDERAEEARHEDILRAGAIRKTGFGQSREGPYSMETAEEERNAGKGNTGKETTGNKPRGRFLDRYTITTTLFLTGLVLSVFMILQTGVLDEIFDYVTGFF